MSRISEFSKIVEANFVACIYKSPVLLKDYESQIRHDLVRNEQWQLFLLLAMKMNSIGAEKFDEYSIASLAKANDRLWEVYSVYGYDLIEEAMSIAELDNFEAYLKQLQKWSIVSDLEAIGFDVDTYIKELSKMNLTEIELFFETQLQQIFNKYTSENIVEHDLKNDLRKLIQDAEKGSSHGMPFIQYPIFDSTIGGAIEGQLILNCGLSGTGKTTFAMSVYLCSCIENGESCVVMINEEDENKWRKDVITWVANNIFNGNYNKRRFREGYLHEKEVELLNKSADWLDEKINSGQILIIPFDYYTVELAIRKIREHAKKGVKHFILDTFKSSYSMNANEQVWLSMMQDMRLLYDTIKPKNLNVTLFTTVQLGKSSANLKYLTQDNIGMAKNIIDTASVCLLSRLLTREEKRNMMAYKVIPGTKTKREIALDEDENYVVLFIEKNRNGWAKERQILMKVDLGKNIYEEVGYIDIPRDFY